MWQAHNGCQQFCISVASGTRDGYLPAEPFSLAFSWDQYGPRLLSESVEPRPLLISKISLWLITHASCDLAGDSLEISTFLPRPKGTQLSPGRWQSRFE